MRNDRFWDPLWALQWDPNSAKELLKLSFFIFMGVPPSRRVKHSKSRSTEWIGPSFCLFLHCFASNLSGYTKHVFLVFVTAPKHRETPSGLTHRNPMATKMEPKIDQAASKWHPFLKDGPPKTCIDLFMHFGRLWLTFGYPLGSN